ALDGTFQAPLELLKDSQGVTIFDREGGSFGIISRGPCLTPGRGERRPHPGCYHRISVRASGGIWQTRRIQVPVGAIPWRFKSSLAHSRMGTLTAVLVAVRNWPTRSAREARPSLERQVLRRGGRRSS